MKTFLPPFHNFFRAFRKLSHAFSVHDLPLPVGPRIVASDEISGDTPSALLNQVPTLFNPFKSVFIETTDVGQKVKELMEFIESDINDRRKDFKRV